jgi:hypothetical protein
MARIDWIADFDLSEPVSQASLAFLLDSNARGCNICITVLSRRMLRTIHRHTLRVRGTIGDTSICKGPLVILALFFEILPVIVRARIVVSLYDAQPF